ncbi:hypothetical protein AMTR_s00038p00194020 [Amborella trichopoda]|uniref:Uncharacterized protein n=1 Tax=Amborella trichopoda TaxID=13333 RepID=U5CNC4_AMBTC|nr:hypothetical protein AMTR_s00038p00194020 [Amborella trichopoda]
MKSAPFPTSDRSHTIKDVARIMGVRGNCDPFSSISPKEGVDRCEAIADLLGGAPPILGKKKGKGCIYLNWLKNVFGDGAEVRARAKASNHEGRSQMIVPPSVEDLEDNDDDDDGEEIDEDGREVDENRHLDSYTTRARARAHRG